ncbi:NUDIX hydrolase [Oceanobacillus salinisoli]|uniref:NUDIX hydrolase n=1 Tax=Oceanobacillus salinisoli TaxID=2678611 RepID=UPI0012E0D105|nr:NUDIX domain-containing protein [Oceanobacillus salinisoli]
MPVIPRPASTVVLMDKLLRVYLTKRPATMKFMGGFHVFPGGAMEESDYVINKKCVITDSRESSLSIAYYITAARELFEEAGILLGNWRDGSPVRLSKEKELKYRSQLQKGEVSLSEVLEREEVYFDCHYLTYLGQMITPKQSPIRFDTRFFLAELPDGQEPDPDEKEVDGAFWVLPEEALTLFKNKKIKLAPPTILTLKNMINYKNGGA